MDDAEKKYGIYHNAKSKLTAKRDLPWIWILVAIVALIILAMIIF